MRTRDFPRLELRQQLVQQHHLACQPQEGHKQAFRGRRLEGGKLSWLLLVEPSLGTLQGRWSQAQVWCGANASRGRAVTGVSGRVVEARVGKGQGFPTCGGDDVIPCHVGGPRLCALEEVGVVAALAAAAWRC